MSQSRKHSAIEAVTNMVVGFILAVVTQILVFPLYGLEATLGQNIQIVLIFTVVTLVRGYVLRRIFNSLSKAQLRD